MKMEQTLTGQSNGFLSGVIEGFYGRPWTLDQRKDLFGKLKCFGMCTYVYAPKDDAKHRSIWRDLYTHSELEHLKILIQGAKQDGIKFVYALSPGLDICYSHTKDRLALQQKLDQVNSLGEVSFALFFDDIEPELKAKDKEVFASFSEAQVSVTNEVYEHLGRPALFLFCPTEYCSSRAVPTVTSSEYLNTLGCNLDPGIDIMWTGSKVISQTIDIDHIKELSLVLKRKPVIWDNLHANDYDQKRLFLGPYSGRSTKLKPYLKGILTNPNCEYEANFIAIYTLALWTRCDDDYEENGQHCVDKSIDTVSTDVEIVDDEESSQLSNSVDSSFSNANNSNSNSQDEKGNALFHPRTALKEAIRLWIPEFYKVKSATMKPPTNVKPFLSTVSPSILLPGEGPPLSNSGTKSPYLSASSEKIDVDDQNYLDKDGEDMELADVSPRPMPVEDRDAVMMMIEKENREKESNKADTKSMISIESDDDEEEMQTEVPELDQDSILTYEDVELLVDLFYLPYEHGGRGLKFLREFHWLKVNGFRVSGTRNPGENNRENGNSFIENGTNVSNTNNGGNAMNGKDSGKDTMDTMDSMIELSAGNGNVVNENTNSNNNGDRLENGLTIKEWFDRADSFNQMSVAISRLFTRLTFCNNRCLLYELYPYIWDVKGVISLLNSYVKWIGLSNGYKEIFHCNEQEPWLFRGGLTGELQRLLPEESIGDLFHYKAPESPSSRIYTIRQYLKTDLKSIYRVCYECNEQKYLTMTPNDTEIIGDRFVGNLLTLSPEYCFVVEDESAICGFALGVADAKSYFRKVQETWLPEMRRKYPLDERTHLAKGSSPFVDKLIQDFHNTNNKSLGVFGDPELIFDTYPSFLNLTVMTSIQDLSVPKRMLACLISTLKANGSRGVYARVSCNEKRLLDFYIKLGFELIVFPSSITTDDFYLGRFI